MTIRYTNDANGITPGQLKGFFVGWPQHPNPETHLQILKNSRAIWLAFDRDRCVGFINALSDGVFYAYIPLLEVLPEYQGLGIGKELVSRMIETLGSMYAIDIVCDENVEPFYFAKGFRHYTAMIKRNYSNQGASNSGAQAEHPRIAGLEGKTD